MLFGRHDQSWESPVGHLARVFARHRGGSFHPTSKRASIVHGLAIGAQVLTALAARPPMAQHVHMERIVLGTTVVDDDGGVGRRSLSYR